MRIIYAALLMVFLSVNPVYAQGLVTQTARNQIDVTVGFVGSTIEIFGNRTDATNDVAILVEGPKVEATVWKKSRILGAWVNAHSTIFSEMPSYYQYATNLDENDEKSREVLRQNGIGHKALFDKVATKKPQGMNVEQFQDALKKKKRTEKVFFEKSEKIIFLNDNFFRAHFDIPASAPTGEYKIHSYLLKNDKIVQHDVSIFKVEQVGLNAFIFNFSHKHSTLYAIVCIILASFSGWLVSVLKVRP